MEVFEVLDGTVTLLEDRLVIEKHHFHQESVTTIDLRDLIAVQYARTSHEDLGWLEFVTAGFFSDIDSKLSMSPRPCQVVLKWDKKLRNPEVKAREEALRFKQLVEDAALAAKTAAPGPSLADELSKLKTLLDQGVLSQEEFDLAKKKLLDP